MKRYAFIFLIGTAAVILTVFSFEFWVTRLSEYVADRVVFTAAARFDAHLTRMSPAQAARLTAEELPAVNRVYPNGKSGSRSATSARTVRGIDYVLDRQSLREKTSRYALIGAVIANGLAILALVSLVQFIPSSRTDAGQPNEKMDTPERPVTQADRRIDPDDLSSLREVNRQLRAEVDNLSTFREVGLAVHSIRDTIAMLRTVSEVLTKKMDADETVIYLKDEHSHVLHPYAGFRRLSQLSLKPLFWEFNSDKDFSGRVDAGEKDSYILAPLYLDRELIGAVRVISYERRYTTHDLEVLTMLAKPVAIAINNAQLYDMAIKDGMTGLYDHDYFQKSIAREMDRCREQDVPLALIFLDIDHFKEVNDTYGHIMGDRIIKAIARLLRQHIRKSDFAYRYGGEEMAVIMPGESENGAYILAEKIRRYVGRHLERSEDGRECRVTVSLGISCFSATSTLSASDLVGQADANLYLAKRDGRNRTVAASHWQGAGKAA